MAGGGDGGARRRVRSDRGGCAASAADCRTRSNVRCERVCKAEGQSIKTHMVHVIPSAPPCASYRAIDEKHTRLRMAGSATGARRL
jgi:hypothetical protein